MIMMMMMIIIIIIVIIIRRLGWWHWCSLPECAGRWPLLVYRFTWSCWWTIVMLMLIKVTLSSLFCRTPLAGKGVWSCAGTTNQIVKIKGLNMILKNFKDVSCSPVFSKWLAACFSIWPTPIHTSWQLSHLQVFCNCIFICILYLYLVNSYTYLLADVSFAGYLYLYLYIFVFCICICTWLTPTYTSWQLSHLQVICIRICNCILYLFNSYTYTYLLAAVSFAGLEDSNHKIPALISFSHYYNETYECEINFATTAKMFAL